MIEPAVKREILRDLDRLSPELQRKALELIRGLAGPVPKGASVEDLVSLGGTLDSDSARQMREAIEAHCERIDPNEW